MQTLGVDAGDDVTTSVTLQKYAELFSNPLSNSDQGLGNSVRMVPPP
jgi:hypothetical protein